MGEARGTVLMVGNPCSGKGRARSVASAVVAELGTRGYEAREVWQVEQRTRVLTELEDAGAAAASPYCCLVVIGGDGTLNAVLNECRRLPIAIVPMGHENLLAKWLGHTAEPVEVARLVAQGRQQPIDLGKVNGRYFAAVASAGLDAWVVQRIAGWRSDGSGQARRGIGLGNYLAAIGAAAWHYEFPPLELEADGKTYSGYHAMVFNAPAYAWGMCAAKAASVDDGLLDWVVFERPGRLAALRYGCRLLRGQPCDGLVRGKAVDVRIRSLQSVPAQVDGDVLGTTPLQVEAAAGAARFLVRGPDKEPWATDA